MAFAGSGRTAVGALRSHSRPTRRRLRALVVCLHRGISQALCAVFMVSGLQPAMWCVPPPARGPRRYAAWLRAELPVRPPVGAPSVSAPLGWLAIKLVAIHAMNTGATGRSGL